MGELRPRGVAGRPVARFNGCCAGAAPPTGSASDIRPAAADINAGNIDEDELVCGCNNELLCCCNKGVDNEDDPPRLGLFTGL